MPRGVNDSMKLQYWRLRHKGDKTRERTSFSIDPVLFEIYANQAGGAQAAKKQLRQWARHYAELDTEYSSSTVSRLVHREIYYVLAGA